MKRLQRLLYTSYISPDEDEMCIPRIVRQSRATNPVLDITGLLIFDGIRLCQYLEGPAEPVFALLDRIRKDQRHIEVSVKELTSTAGPRLADEWPLGFATRSQVDSLDVFHGFDLRTGKSAIALLQNLLPTLAIDNSSP